VTGDYFLLASSVENAPIVRSQDKFSFVARFRPFDERHARRPGDICDLRPRIGLDEASRALADSSSQRMLPFISAVIHAFHSQRAYLAVEKDGLSGRLAVAFDREGALFGRRPAKRDRRFRLANAMIRPGG